MPDNPIQQANASYERFVELHTQLRDVLAELSQHSNLADVGNTDQICDVTTIREILAGDMLHKKADSIARILVHILGFRSPTMKLVRDNKEAQ